MLKNGLSIIIPTFNRKEQLNDQLKLIFESQVDLIEEIVIIDNHSDYDIGELIASFKSKKIRLIIHPFNIKGHNNIAFAFFCVQTEWLWLLSDDDEIEGNAIEEIKKEIENASTDVGMIKFARTNSPQKEFTANTIESFIDYYYNEKVIRSGDLVFMSTNVYNITRLSNYLGYAFEYAYTYVPQIIPIVKGLDEKKVSIKFSDKSIVKYLPPREGNFSFSIIGKGLSTFSHIPLNLTKKYQRKFLDIMMSIKYPLMIHWSLNNESIKELRIVYNNIYRYYIPLKGKFIIKLFLCVMSNRLARILILDIYKKIKTKRQELIKKK